MNHKLESKLAREITTSDCRWYHFNGKKWERTKETVDEGERGVWKNCLNFFWVLSAAL